MSDSILVDVILVPAGFEYFVVRSSIVARYPTAPTVIPIPMGPGPLVHHLQHLLDDGLLFKPASRILLMGLGGGLSTELRVGDGMLMEECGFCLDHPIIEWLPCARDFLEVLSFCLADLPRGRMLTTSTIICNSSDKQQLRSHTLADVVDMEGFPALKILSEAGHHVAILRVISDDCHHDLPNLSSVVSSSGALSIFPLVCAFLRRPQDSFRFILGSLAGLRSLGRLATQLSDSKPSSVA
jgi:hypothetical protein